MPLAAILFDIDDTLYSTSEFARTARRNALQAMLAGGLAASIGDLERELAEVVAEFTSNYDHHFDRLLSRLPPEAIRGRNRSMLIAAAVVAYHDTKFTQLAPYPDVPAALAALQRAPDLQLGVITEGLAIKQAEKLLRLGVASYFSPNAIFISDAIGISKPNPKLYRHALRALGLEPGSAMYVGDNPHKDIDPAGDVGMVTVRVRRGGRHHDACGRREPDFTISSFTELLELIRVHFPSTVRTESR